MCDFGILAGGSAAMLILQSDTSLYSVIYVNVYWSFNIFQQQDVSEFTHKLLDWLEDAFQIKAEEER